jgi:ATP-dependent DNA helicase DinG
MPSRLLSAFPPGTPILRVTLNEALVRLSGGGAQSTANDSAPMREDGIGH